MARKFFKPSLGLIYTSLLVGSAVSQAETQIPTDAQETCTVSETTLNKWFAQGDITKGGMVWPANSLDPVFADFDGNSRCDFYKWGAQMFLWLSSPVGNAYVFDGPSFYDVIHSGSGFKMLSNSVDTLNNNFNIRTLKDDDPIDSTGQAGGSGVLISQQDSLTYYGINVNDVFAYYRTGEQAGAFKGTDIATEFPNTIQGLRRVEDFAGRSFKDGEALVMEIKTSWVDASTVDASQYLVIDAMVPWYKKVSDTKWALQADSAVSKKLALVGMHVVGTVNGHPEMVWATFEHLDNVPDQDFYYTNNKGKRVEHEFDSEGKWTFTKSNTKSTTKVNEYQVVAGSKTDCVIAKTCNVGDIVAINDSKIQENNVIRQDPWGSEPNNKDKEIVSNNTDLISLNHSILPWLKGVGDVRANYFQVGSIWTARGEIPKNGSSDELRGSLSLANTTMETFHQASSTSPVSFKPINCFGCHGVTLPSTSTPPQEAFDVSHIFSSITPLNVEK
ncbi:hypothetical protein [Pseudoalteromonas aurantia]|uniref:Uncharacterized protein n=1 Tax=Pseudoalteromonas aurantia 208 TaxID=1314867 RepID=A0ABR9EBX2_9GAMM|nr:hypothetical protein [Pseudoalteromonas aurantia]MBE0368496.1 hypothetical protein [Pseudoalteromonas aurantia 208]